MTSRRGFIAQLAALVAAGTAAPAMLAQLRPSSRATNEFVGYWDTGHPGLHSTWTTKHLKRGATLQDAVNVAQPGDTIMQYPEGGFYLRSVVVHG